MNIMTLLMDILIFPGGLFAVALGCCLPVLTAKYMHASRDVLVLRFISHVLI